MLRTCASGYKMLDSGSEELGAWTGDNLSRTAQAASSSGVDAALPYETQFLASVAKAINRRRERAPGAGDSTLPTIFFMGVRPDSVPLARKVRVLNNGEVELTGRVWFVNNGMTAGDECFRTKASVEVELAVLAEQYDLGNRAAITYDVAEPNIVRWFRAGIDHGSAEMSISNAQVSLSE